MEMAYLTSPMRVRRFLPGVKVVATASAPEYLWGLVGKVLHLRMDGAPAVVVEWEHSPQVPRWWGNGPRTFKHFMMEVKLAEGEDWDEDGRYPVPVAPPEPDPDMEQMMLGGAI